MSNLGTQILSDNRVIHDPREFRRLRTRRRLTDRTLILEAPHVAKMVPQYAKILAVAHLSDAVIGGCGYILIKGLRWSYEFNTQKLNNEIGRRFPGRTGIFQNPFEKQAAGCFYDTTRQLYTVPRNFNLRERKSFPTPAESRT